MAPLKASRTLLKSSPELWAECSDAASLARHLGAFGEIRITKLEPETAVAWEGEDVRGTVTLEPSGWGTRVILTAVPAAGSDSGPPAEETTPEDAAVEDARAEDAPADVAPAPEPEPEAVAPEPEAVAPDTPEPETPADPEPVAEPRKPGFFARLFGRRPRPEPAAEAPVATETPVAAEPEAPAEPEASEPEPGMPEPTASEVSAEPAGDRATGDRATGGRRRRARPRRPRPGPRRRSREPRQGSPPAVLARLIAPPARVPGPPPRPASP